MIDSDDAIYEVTFISDDDITAMEDAGYRERVEALLEEGGPLFTTMAAAIKCLDASFESAKEFYKDTIEYTKQQVEDEDAIAIRWVHDEVARYFGMVHKRVIYNDFIPEVQH